GIAEACVGLARESVGSRRHSHTGELLGAEPVVAHRLGQLWVRVQGAAGILENATAAADAGDPDALMGILASKVAAVDAAADTANEAMTLAGGRAYGANSKLARMLRDARAGHVMAPTTDMLLTWIGRAQLGLPLL
ncbi:MAG TPA: acyl-CoA dehydrogenase family protein, partial [Longimicrobiales bacterium]|nr:acyl-CoA dehydrogenase family protein [Longimicrobiales bacterium]